MLKKNVASQKVRVFAFDSTTNLPKTGDAANITAYLSKDYGAVTQLADTSATEESSSNAAGMYWFDISQSETNADDISITAKSSTANIVVVGAPARIRTTPQYSGDLVIDSSGRVDVSKISGTSQTARDIGASVLISPGTGTGQLSVTSGVIASNVTQFGGSNGTFSSGRPEVNTTHWAGTAVASATVRSDLINIAGVAVSASTAQLGVNVVNFGGSAGTFSSGIPSVNAAQISGDSVAADNLESMFDGTGYTDDNAPASRSQVNGLVSSGSGGFVGTVQDSNAGGTNPLNGVTFVGVLTSGTFANLAEAGGTGLTLDDTANVIDVVFEFDIPRNATPMAVNFAGYLTSANDSCPIQVYDHDATAWVTVATLVGQGGTSNTTLDIALGETRFKSVNGEVYVRFRTTSTDNQRLFLDRLVAEYVNQTVGYAFGAVWIDTLDGEAGTTAFVNGVADNTVLTLADARTIADEINVHRFQITNGSTITLASATTGKVFDGHEWILALAGQDISNSMFIDATVFGTGTGTGAEFEDCEFGTTTLGPSQLYNCGIGSTLTIGSTGSYLLVDCFSSTTTASSPVIDLGSGVGATVVKIRRWSGGLTLNNVQTGDFVSVNSVSGGTVTVNGTGGTVLVTGMISVSDGSGGSVTISQNSAISRPAINAEVDTALADVGLTSTVTGRIDAAISTRQATFTSATGVTFPTNFGSLGINGSGHVSRVTLTDTVTTYTGNTPQTGDSYARIGATGSGLTSLAPSATALSTATWTGTRAGYLDNLSGGAVALASGVNLTTIAGAPVAVDTGTAGTISFVSGAYVATSGDTVSANVVQIDGENVQHDGNGYLRTDVRNYYDTASTSYQAFPVRFSTVQITTDGDVVAFGYRDTGGAVGLFQDSFALISTVTDKLDDTVEDDAGTYRFTVHALSQAPTGGSAPTVQEIVDGVLDEALSGHVTSGTVGNAIAATLVAASEIGTNGDGLTAIPWNPSWDAEVQSEAADALAAVGVTSTRMGYIDNVNNANLANVPAFPTNFSTLGINGSGHLSRVTLVDTLTANSDKTGYGLAADAVNSTSVAASAVTELQSGLATSAAIAAVDAKIDIIDDIVDLVLADTNELQADWANGGRLDTILDARASQTSVDALPNAAAIVLAMRNWAVFSGYNWETLQKELAAALAGNVTGDGTQYRSPVTNAVVLTVAADENGNRTVTRS